MANKIPYSISKSKLKTYFLNEDGTPVSRTTFRNRSGLAEFCQNDLKMSADEYRKRKMFFGDEVKKIFEKYQIELE